MTPTWEQQKEARLWLEAHEVNPSDVPVWSQVVWDAGTLEWVITVYERHAAGKIRIDGGEAVLAHVRRVHRGIDPPAWFVWESA